MILPSLYDDRTEWSPVARFHVRPAERDGRVA